MASFSIFNCGGEDDPIHLFLDMHPNIMPSGFIISPNPN
jgi:hypothetical protein